MDYGYTIYPCYTFNENKIVYTLNYFENFRLWLNSFKLPACLFLAKFGLWPRTDIDLLIVIGKGIKFPKLENITSELVEEYHGIYIKELCSLFDRYKGRFGIKKDLVLY